MYRLPFNPEPPLAFFMTKENAGSLAGDLEERFERICRRKGRLAAILWFWWALLISVPPILTEAINMKPTRSNVPSGGPRLAPIAFQEPDEFELPEPDSCRTWTDCLGNIRWDVEDGHGGHAGFCTSCGTFHVKCGNCGEISFYEGHEVHCDACEVEWEFDFEDYEVVEMRCLNPDAEEGDSATVADTAMLRP